MASALWAVTGCTQSIAHRANSLASQVESADPTPIEATSLLGKGLTAPELEPATRQERLAQLDEAQQLYDRDPHDEMAIIWLGRRLAYLGRYRQAIDVFSNGLAIHPQSYRLRRHRGHRYITVREFDHAIVDLRQAADLVLGVADEVEPDGQPNRLNVPTSTSHTNIFYHLGLAHYLKGEFEAAERAYRRCLEFANHDDMKVATSYWLYLTLRRLGKDDQAAEVLDGIRSDMNVIENASYHRLLLMFKREMTAEELVPVDAAAESIDIATIGYGLGMRDLFNNEIENAQGRFETVIAESNWAAFGHIAAEAELARKY